jgi:ribonucleoside-diphosphate reductase alpha chain
MQEINASTLMSDAKFYESYARFDGAENRYETWNEAVDRVMNMHRIHYNNVMTPELERLIQYSQDAYRSKQLLGAQRALQFGGEQLLRNNAKLYNCTATYLDRVDFFKEALFLMLSGCGIGFSVQTQHISKLPSIKVRTKSAKTFVVPDSIEGWSSAVGALMSSYFISGGDKEYRGHKIYFDLNKIRPKGAEISGGFKAPGPEPLRIALTKIERMLEDELTNNRTTLRSIIAYDITMFLADAVISGGVRRAASICLFSKDDEEMITAKTGSWFIDNPQRGRSNNSAVLLRQDTTKEEFNNIIKSVKEYGEPGFVWTDDLEILFNPCVEVGMYAYDENGESGWQMCNLSEINGSMSNTPEEFYKQCKAASILGTLQAGYTDFEYLTKATKNIVDREALIGVGITGWMNNPDVLFDKEVQQKGAAVVKKWNKIVADMIGINQAARTTVVKPSGNASVILGTASGIHGEHSPRYLRHVQMNKETEVAKLLAKTNPILCQDSVWSQGTDYVIAFPIVSKPGSIYKKDLLGVKQLEYVKNAQENWIEYGTNPELCVKPYLRHNVSNTITVDDWDEVEDYIFTNRNSLCGVSLLPKSGDKAFPQAPFTEVLTMEEITAKYGTVSMFSSGLIEAGLNAFNNNLWTALDTAQGYGEILEDTHEHLLKRDFVRRFNNFAKKFTDEIECSNCLKDVYNLHKWWKIQDNIHIIDWIKELDKKEFVDIDTLGSQGCVGNQCEINF